MKIVRKGQGGSEVGPSSWEEGVHGGKDGA